jgi:hypothetical protein
VLVEREEEQKERNEGGALVQEEGCLALSSPQAHFLLSVWGEQGIGLPQNSLIEGVWVAATV